MRQEFASALLEEAKNNPNIILVTGDLGFGLWNEFRETLPNQFINCGASEQLMMGMGVGIALEEKIAVIYSITTFLLYRPFETIRNYIDREKIPVKLIGSGRNKDYIHDGFSHWSEDVRKLFFDSKEQEAVFPNIKDHWPQNKREIPGLVHAIINSKTPEFVSLTR